MTTQAWRLDHTTLELTPYRIQSWGEVFVHYKLSGEVIKQRIRGNAHTWYKDGEHTASAIGQGIRKHIEGFAQLIVDTSVNPMCSKGIFATSLSFRIHADSSNYVEVEVRANVGLGVEVSSLTIENFGVADMLFSATVWKFQQAFPELEPLPTKHQYQRVVMWKK